MSEVIRSRILSSGAWERGKFILPSGIANNRFNLAKILDIEPLKNLIVGELVSKTLLTLRGRDPDAVWGMSDSGQLFAEAVADRLKVPMVHIHSTEIYETARPRYIYAPNDFEEHVLHNGLLIGYTDFIDSRHTINQALSDLPDLRERTPVIFSVWNRGDPETQEQSPVEHVSLITEYLPNMIEADDPRFQGLLKQYGEFMVDAALD